MNKVFTVVFGLLALGASAQDFKPFKVNLSLGLAKPTGAGSSGGVLVSVEPKYGLTDQVDVGLRMEGALMGRAGKAAAEGFGGEANLSSSYVLTGNYLFTVSNFRPYVGLGTGLYATKGLGFNAESSAMSVEMARKLGAMFRAGFKTGHFTMGIEFNVVPSTAYAVSSKNVTAIIQKKNNSYIGVKIGLDLGGGYDD